VKDLEEEHHTIYNMAELEKNNPSNKGARIPTVVVTPTNDSSRNNASLVSTQGSRYEVGYVINEIEFQDDQQSNCWAFASLWAVTSLQ
jgi:hypothetical protein